MTKGMWARVVAALQVMGKTEAQLEQSREAWEMAKATRDERVATHDEASQLAAEEHPIELPDDVWQRLQGLYADRRRSEEAFDVADRARRSNQDLLKKLQERILVINTEAYAADSELPFADTTSGPAWTSVALADYMGPIHAEPYAKAGISTLVQAKEAVEAGRHLELASAGEISDEQARYLAWSTCERLDAFGADHKCPRITEPAPLPATGKGKKSKLQEAVDEDPAPAGADAEPTDEAPEAKPEKPAGKGQRNNANIAERLGRLKAKFQGDTRDIATLGPAAEASFLTESGDKIGDLLELLLSVDLTRLDAWLDNVGATRGGLDDLLTAMEGLPGGAAGEGPDRMSPFEACAALGVAEARLRGLVSQGRLQEWVAGKERWHSRRQVIELAGEPAPEEPKPAKKAKPELKPVTVKPARGRKR